MTRSFVEALQAEVASLEAELTKNETYQRLEKARQLLEHYIVLHRPPARLPPSLPPSLLGGASRRGSVGRAKALEAARLFLVNRTNEPTPTAVIYDHIVSLGIEIGGNDPKNNLSAMLSNASSIFQSHGRAGWTLKDAEQNIARPTALPAVGPAQEGDDPLGLRDVI